MSYRNKNRKEEKNGYHRHHKGSIDTILIDWIGEGVENKEIEGNWKIMVTLKENVWP